jgi:hypothetical protein
LSDPELGLHDVRSACCGKNHGSFVAKLTGLQAESLHDEVALEVTLAEFIKDFGGPKVHADTFDLDL